MTFLHNNIYKDKENDEFKFDKVAELIALFRATAQCCYWNWLNNRGIGGIKSTIYKIVRAISQGDDYKNIYAEKYLC